MSAIEPLGYPDWQRLTNWDGPVLWQANGYIGQGPLISPTMRVDRYNSVAGVIDMVSGKAVCSFSWYADQGLTTLIGQRIFPLDGDIGAAMFYAIFNMAAWLQVMFLRVGAPDFRVLLAVSAMSNRAFPAISQASNPVVVSEQNQPVAAGATNVYPSQLIGGGRAHLWCNGEPGKIYAGIWTFTQAGVYVQVAAGSSGADGNLNLDVAMPLGSSQVRITNIDGVAHNIYTSLVYYES